MDKSKARRQQKREDNRRPEYRASFLMQVALKMARFRRCQVASVRRSIQCRRVKAVCCLPGVCTTVLAEAPTLCHDPPLLLIRPTTTIPPPRSRQRYEVVSEQSFACS